MSAPQNPSYTVVLAVTGGIAVYKACEVLRGLQKANCDVWVVMSEDATRFVGTPTFEALSGHPVVTSLYDMPGDPIPHIDLADRADLCLVVPATANVMAKMAHGIADDALSTTLLAMHSPVVLAPAMNVHMWQNPATQANLATLRSRGVYIVDPTSGLLACGDVGEGKLATVDDIVSSALHLLNETKGPEHFVSETIGTEPPADPTATVTPSCAGIPTQTAPVHDLAGRRIVITAGPTHEAIDPVRYIANASTGKMGYTIAAEAARRGAKVTLVSGPTALRTPAGVLRVDVVSAAQMHDATVAAFADADCAICSAAVADYTPAHPADHKLKKNREHLDTIELVETTDILAELGSTKGARTVVGFAAETNDLIANAQSKLVLKHADMIVANDVSRKDSTFGADTSRIALVTSEGVEQFETMPLPQVAATILDHLPRMRRRG